MWTTAGSGEVAASAARATGARRRTRALVKCIVVFGVVGLWVRVVLRLNDSKCEKSKILNCKRVNGADRKEGNSPCLGSKRVWDGKEMK